ncbi:CRISPR-associated endonuclease Cas9 [Ceratobasidium theobromae]|uniref:CRISPR-associated endonuclease Cas9 n=1 Tax=Ceratobasidium theobromae TaxID=1582974 RepID=A0A5N5QAW5_9AGAM|nr:CRISPR-associated endonuclease Cas9 [Ceratobasidium theobromae]
MTSHPQHPIRSSSTGAPLVTGSVVATGASNNTVAGGEGNSTNSNSGNPPNPPNSESPARLLKRPFEATTNTPVRTTSSRTGGKSRASRANKSGGSRATHSRIHVSEPAAPRAINQPAMDVLIEAEMRDAILHDPKFIEHFLSGDSNLLDRVVQRCSSSEAYNQDKREWKIPAKIPQEQVLYTPVQNILNAIKHAVDHSINSDGNDIQDSSDHEDSSTNSSGDPDDVSIWTTFRDTSNNPIPSDDADTAGLEPDLTLFEHVTYRHWETLRMPVEIKRLAGHHKHGMKQLSRYARAVFAHQIHRRHLYGLMVCGTEATFVRFDRAGILYSRRVDVREQSEAFTRAFASLLMLDRADQGYDTAFTTELNSDGRLEYYIDLPESAFKDTKITSTAGPSNKKLGKRRLKVLEKLCHRKSIRGRATIVLRVSEVGERETRGRSGKRKVDEVDNAEGPNLKEYVLKIIWRDPKRESEGEVMEQVKGIYGLAQYVWHCDVPGRCRCSSPRGGECANCVDETVQVEELEVCDNLRDISVYVPLENKDEESSALKCIDTTQLHPTPHGRKRRIYSYILMSSVGVPLLAAQDPHQFMKAVLDAILGYWRLVNLGILHRDISDGNVMMLAPDQEFEQKEWEEDHSGKPKATDPILAESEEKLREILTQLDRSPTGMLSDFDLHARHTSAALPEVPVGPFDATVGRSVKSSLGSDAPCTGPMSAVPSREDSAVEMPISKRRRTNSGSSISIASATPETTKRVSVTSSEPSRSEGGKQGQVDFRTGTPAFMSLRVLEVSPGNPYHHSFLDDLESFFWLIFWCAAAHLDASSHNPTQDAQDELDFMDEYNLKALANWKRSKLSQCSQNSGKSMKRLLKSFKNGWASHPIFINVIVHLGCFFSETDYESLSETKPADVFSRFVNIIFKELDPAQ